MNRDRLFDFIGWTLLITAILLLRISESLLDNIIQAKSFLLIFSITGLLLSSALLLIIYKSNPKYFQGGEKRASAVLSYFFGVIVLSLVSAAYYNFNTSKVNTSTISAIVAEKSKNVKYKSTYLYLKIGNKLERFHPNRKEWEKISEKDTLQLTIGHGILGYKHILEFSPQGNN